MRYAIAFVLLVGCGDDPIDLTGVYQVNSAVGSMPCGNDTAIADFAPFVHFTKDEFFGAPFFQYDGCMDAEATDCSSLGTGFFEPLDDGWLGRLSFSSGGGSFPCALGLTRETAILHGTALVIESTTSQGEVDGLSEAQCSPDEAEARADELPCTEHSLVDATKL